MNELSNYSLKSYNYIEKKNVFELLIFLITYPHINILKFEQLIIQRISLLMYKYSTVSVPQPILGLFKKSNEVHTHFTPNSNISLHCKGEVREEDTTFSFKGVHNGTTYQVMSILVYLIRVLN